MRESKVADARHGAIELQKVFAGETTLFGSNHPHTHFMCLTIRGGYQSSDGTVFPDNPDTKIQVFISTQDFIQLIAGIASNACVPCTIKRFGNKKYDSLRELAPLEEYGEKLVKDNLCTILRRYAEDVEIINKYIELKKIPAAVVPVIKEILEKLPQDIAGLVDHTAEQFKRECESIILDNKLKGDGNE